MEKTTETRDDSDYLSIGTNELSVDVTVSVRAYLAGTFVSRGLGRHPDRRIDSYELIFVRSGVLELWEEDRQYRVGPGECLLLWADRRHGGLTPYSPELSYYWIHFYMDLPCGGEDRRVSIPQHIKVA
ncbi:MAG: hypothetical protein EOP84_34670, partial [Verrucomicrobiaceae bacterium]